LIRNADEFYAVGVNPDGKWFSGDRDSAVDNILRRAEQLGSGSRVLVDFRVLVFLLYYIRDKRAGTIRVTATDVETDGSHLTQQLLWQFDGRDLPLHTFISLKQIRDYPGIEVHGELLRQAGFLV